MARIHVRCSKETCKKRAVFSMHPDEYKIPRKCEGCGGSRFRVIKKWHRERGDRMQCTCAGRVYGEVKASDHSASMPPHVRGSQRCWYRKDGTTRMPGDEDFNDPDYHEQDDTEQADSLIDG